LLVGDWWLLLRSDLPPLGMPVLKGTYQGGYNLDSISNSALAVVKVISGEPPDELPPMVAGESATETVWEVAMEQSKYWKSVDPKACEPQEGKCGHIRVLSAVNIAPEYEPITFSIPGEGRLT
jgi:hypothetical protein